MAWLTRLKVGVVKVGVVNLKVGGRRWRRNAPGGSGQQNQRPWASP